MPAPPSKKTASLLGRRNKAIESGRSAWDSLPWPVEKLDPDQELARLSCLGPKWQANQSRMAEDITRLAKDGKPTTRNMISNWITGVSAVNYRQLQRIADALGTSVEDLRGEMIQRISIPGAGAISKDHELYPSLRKMAIAYVEELSEDSPRHLALECETEPRKTE